MGRPPLELNEKLIEDLASIHCTTVEIAVICGCSTDTLERRFMEVILLGRANAKSSLRRHQWKLAESGNATMLIWLGKQLLGQRDFKSDMADFTDEMLAAEIRRRMSVGISPPSDV